VYTNVSIFPAVPRGNAILRTSCMATHSAEQIETAVELMTRLGRQHNLIS
jgi:8-amino-7-oxononanoate synthase